MATLAEIQTYAVGNPALKQRFAAARLQKAWDVMAEAPGTAQRRAWATKIFTNYAADIDKEYTWFLGTSQVQSTGNGITDANCVLAVASLIDAWSA